MHFLIVLLTRSQNDKECLVEIEFSVGNVEYKVIRGMKPTVFEIHKNGEKLPQKADSKDDQRHLEANILKLNYKSFTQIVVLGSSSFVPFMQLPAAHRREVIEDLLDIKIFSSMNAIVKEKIKEIKDEVKTLELKKESLNDKVQMQQNFIEELEKSGNNNISLNKENIDNIIIRFFHLYSNHYKFLYQHK